MPGPAGGFSPQALRHPWRMAGIFALFFVIMWVGMNAWNHSLSLKAVIVGLGITVIIVLVVRGIAAADRRWRQD